jgi:RHS repeat-associated protein
MPPPLGDETADTFHLVDPEAGASTGNNDTLLLSTVESLGVRGERRLMAGADTDHAIAWPRRGASDVRRQWHQILGMTNKAGAHELDHIYDVDALYRRTKVGRVAVELHGRNTGIVPVLGNGRLDRSGEYSQDDRMPAPPRWPCSALPLPTREPRRLAGAETDRAQARPRRGEGAERRRLNQNRLISMQSAGSQIVVGTITQNIPSLYIAFSYDGRSRRIGKVVRTAAHNASPYSPSPMSWPVTLDERYIYDGWNLVARLKDGNPTLAGFQPALVQTYVWGPDLSGTMEGAGGVGGLLQIKDWEVNKTWAPCYDGNGNILSLIRLDQTTPNALTICEGRYEYDPFGNLLRVTGEAAERTPFRFSTKYTDNETGLVYYGYRYYKPDWGKWINRDPLGEEGGANLFAIVGNQLTNGWDLLGKIGGWGGAGNIPGINPISGNPINPPPPFKEWNDPKTGERRAKVSSCNIVIFIGHNDTVPQGTIECDPNSAAARYSCHGSVSGNDPGVPSNPIPGAPEPVGHGGYDDGNGLMDKGTKALEDAKKYAKTLCEDATGGCRSVKITSDCKDLPFGMTNYFTGLLHRVCNINEEIQCGK